MEMSKYQVVIKRTNDNPITGRAQYRVVSSREIDQEVFENSKRVISLDSSGTCILHLEHNVRKGDFINPRKALGIPKKVVSSTKSKGLSPEFKVADVSLNNESVKNEESPISFNIYEESLMSDIHKEESHSSGMRMTM